MTPKSQRYRIGMMIRTSYGTGPYLIKDIVGDCTCPSFLDSLSAKDPPKSKPHYHFVCSKVGDNRNNYYLNGYDENLNSVWDSDRLIVCEEETLFLTMCTNII